MEHTKAELQVLQNYHDSIDEEILEYVKRIYNGEKEKPITVGFLSENAAKNIEYLTGLKVYGNRIILDDNGVMHIRKRHGKNGEQDDSMKNIEDIARIGYVLANYDSIDYYHEYAQGYVDASGKLAPKVVIRKKIDGTFYVIEAVSDAKKRRNYIVSAYIKDRKKESDFNSP